jgi:hypothetical protein
VRRWPVAVAAVYLADGHRQECDPLGDGGLAEDGVAEDQATRSGAGDPVRADAADAEPVPGGGRHDRRLVEVGREPGDHVLPGGDPGRSRKSANVNLASQVSTIPGQRPSIDAQTTDRAGADTPARKSAPMFDVPPAGYIPKLFPVRPPDGGG